MIFCTGCGIMSNTYRKAPDNDSLGTGKVAEAAVEAISRARFVFFGRNCCLDIFGFFWSLGL